MPPELSAPSALANPDTTFTLLMENVKDYAIFLTDPAGQIVRWNVGAEHILGYSEAEVLGQMCNLIFTPEDNVKREPQRERDQAAREGRSVDERWHVRKNGSRFWASGIMTALFNSER